MFRIGYYSDAKVYGGAEKYLEMLAIGMASKGHDCFFMVNEKNVVMLQNLEELGLRYFARKMGERYYDVHYHWPLFKFFRGLDIDLLHINMPGPYNCCLVPITARLSGIKHVITTEHLPMNRRWPKPGFLKDISNPWLDCSITVSYGNLEYMSTLHRIPKEIVEVIQNGIDVDHFSPDFRGHLRWPMRKRYGFSETNIVFGVVGRLTAQKGHAYAVEAFARIHEKFPDLRMIFVGEGELADEYKHLVSKAGLDSKVVFAGFHTDMKPIYACIDVLLMPSLFEGLPLVLLEAMAMKIPAIATRINGIPEVVNDHHNGILIDPKDPEAIIQAIIEFAQGGKIETYGENAYNTIRERFSLNKMVNRTEDTYRRCINSTA